MHSRCIVKLLPLSARCLQMDDIFSLKQEVKVFKNFERDCAGCFILVCILWIQKKNQKNIIFFYPIFFLVLFRWRCKCKKGGLSNIVLKKSNIIGMIINMTIQGKQKEWIYEWICDWRIGGMIDRWWITEKQNMRHAEINTLMYKTSGIDRQLEIVK